jgi:hypothetical protein
MLQQAVPPAELAGKQQGAQWLVPCKTFAAIAAYLSPANCLLKLAVDLAAAACFLKNLQVPSAA